MVVKAVGFDIDSILGKQAKQVEFKQWHPGPTPDVKKCQKKDVDTSDFCSAMQHPLNEKVFGERTKRDKEARDMFEKIEKAFKSFNSSASEESDNKKDIDDKKDKDNIQDKKDKEAKEKIQPKNWAMSTGVCKQVLEDALCLAAFPPCQCDDYKTACLINCGYMNQCAQDAGAPMLCNSCEKYCEHSCCISIDKDMTPPVAIPPKDNCRSSADTVQAPLLSLLTALVAFATLY